MELIVKKGRKKYLFLTLIVIIGLFNLFFQTNKSPAINEKSTDIIAGDSEANFENSDSDIDEGKIGQSSTTLQNDSNEDVLSYVTNPARETARVLKVRDGDTIEVEIGGEIKVVRYIGIDTPETVDPRKYVQCFGAEASNINKSLVENQTVFLEKDVSETDKYGRLLRYVYMGDLFINKYLVQEGFAHSSAYPPDISRQWELDQAEEVARLSNKGLWGSCGSVSNYSPKSSTTISSDDKDCSDFSTHQEAQDYFNSKGGSNTNNVDKLDGSDHDGLVCETLP